MKSLQRRMRRGISPVIATLLLIAIAVAAAVVVYSWTMTMIKTQSSQAQTTIRIDQVQFGQTPTSGSLGSTTIDVAEPTPDTVLSVALTTNFALGDYIKISETGKASNYGTITAIDSGNTITIDTATTVAYTTAATVTEYPANGVLISLRNTGSVPAVIQTVYVYKGDSAVLEKDLISYAIQASTVKKLGCREDANAWANLKSGGQSLSTVDKEITGLSFTTDLAVSTGYVIKVVTDNGFTIEGTYYTPSSFTG